MTQKLSYLMAAVLFVAFAAAAPLSATPCKTTAFKTELGKAACAKGGIEEAKKAWKTWMDTAKKTNKNITSCKSCHTTISAPYTLKPDAVTIFKAAGGK